MNANAIVCLTALLGSLSLPARADSPGSPAPGADSTAAGTGELGTAPSSPAPAERMFLFTDDPSIPAPGHVVVSAGVGSVTRTGEERPVGAGDAIPTTGAEIGILRRLSFAVDAGFVFWKPGSGNGSPVTVEAGPRILLTSPESRSLFFTLAPAYGLDFYGHSEILLNAAFAWTRGILRLAASATISHTFQDDADPLDVQASLGASVGLPLGFRVGLEGVVTDLEEIAGSEAEGGASAFAGPTLGWSWGHLFQIVAGPAYGFGPSYSGFLARAAASAQF